MRSQSAERLALWKNTGVDALRYLRASGRLLTLDCIAISIFLLTCEKSHTATHS